MPNGFYDDPSIDFVVLRHTLHGEPRFHTRKGVGAMLSVHIGHHRGYAYEPSWEAVDLAPLIYPRRGRPTRAEADAIAAELVAKVTALLSSNPSSLVRAEHASAFLAIDGWCVPLGGYHLYTRASGRSFERVERPFGRRMEEALQLIEERPELAFLARNTHVVVERGLPMHEPAACVVDLDPVEEWIATTVPLHEHALWEEIARAPLDTVESSGHLLCAARDLAVEQRTDHIVIRGRRPPRAAPEAAPEAPAEDTPGAELRVVWGPELRRPYFLFATSLIGRGEDCDIQLDDDGVSRHHARIMRVDGRYVLRDLGSTNGTFVNGERAARYALGDGDIVALGAQRLQFWSGHRTIWEPHLRRHDDRRIIAALAEEAPLARSGEREVSLVLFDLDHFHRLNARIGYPAGDAVLTHVESVARATLRAEDTLSRIGGEEFGIVLPGLGLEAARQVAEDVRRAVDAASYVHEGQEVHVTISCGVAAWSSRTGRPWQLVREAEARLYDAKVGGRNRVC